MALTPMVLMMIMLSYVEVAFNFLTILVQVFHILQLQYHIYPEESSASAISLFSKNWKVCLICINLCQFCICGNHEIQIRQIKKCQIVIGSVSESSTPHRIVIFSILSSAVFLPEVDVSRILNNCFISLQVYTSSPSISSVSSQMINQPSSSVKV